MTGSRRAIVVAAIGGAALTGLLVAVLALPLLLTHRDDLPFERAYAGAMVELVSRMQAGDATNPSADSAQALINGRNSYTGTCAMCHGAVGDGRGSLGAATYPDAADLTSERTRGKTDAQLFWITKNGLSFTAMPGFGTLFKDDEIWQIVTYIRAVQRGRAQPIPVPEPTAAQLAVADPHGDAAARGAAVFYAQGCFRCHGPDGGGGIVSVRGGGSEDAIRRGQSGMPSFGPDRISDADIADLVAFLRR